jgi:hypothetical protein
MHSESDICAERKKRKRERERERWRKERERGDYSNVLFCHPSAASYLFKGCSERD